MNYSELFKVIGHEIRLDIIKLLLEGETCGCTLINKLPISQPTLSYHLNALTKAGIAESKREGNWIKYYIKRDVLTELSAFFLTLASIGRFN
jgi:ArsR family transcriptional regulator, arsenate/arsenite/antimonite-responsive transcriptional repressor